MYLPKPTLVDGICMCSGLADCDHHACCGGCPDNTDYGCGECWSRDCYEHNIRDMVELLEKYEREGRPRNYREPVIKFIEDWRRKYGNSRD